LFFKFAHLFLQNSLASLLCRQRIGHEQTAQLR